MPTTSAMTRPGPQRGAGGGGGRGGCGEAAWLISGAAAVAVPAAASSVGRVCFRRADRRQSPPAAPGVRSPG